MEPAEFVIRAQDEAETEADINTWDAMDLFQKDIITDATKYPILRAVWSVTIGSAAVAIELATSEPE